MEGIFSWHVHQTEELMKDKSDNMLMREINRISKVYEEIFKSVKISDWNKPFEFSDDPELGLRNPYSKISCFIVQLYSMELGHPPFYSEVNKAAREMDLSFIKELGPFLRVLSKITLWAERNKQPDDKVKSGEMLGGVFCNLSGAFLLWKGAPMKQD